MNLAFLGSVSRLAAQQFSLIELGAEVDCLGGEIGSANIRPILVTSATGKLAELCSNRTKPFGRGC